MSYFVGFLFFNTYYKMRINPTGTLAASGRFFWKECSQELQECSFLLVEVLMNGGFLKTAIYIWGQDFRKIVTQVLQRATATGKGNCGCCRVGHPC